VSKRKVKRPSTQSALEDKFLLLWQELAPDLPLQPQYADGRIRGKSRCLPFDFKVADAPVLIEINGGTAGFMRSGHTSTEGIRRDYIKINKAQMAGFFVFVLSTTMVTPLHVKEIVDFSRRLCYNGGNKVRLFYHEIPP
jgi:hypothetical protein